MTPKVPLKAELTTSFSVSAKASIIEAFFVQHPKVRWSLRGIGIVEIIISPFVGPAWGIVIGAVLLVVTDIVGRKGWRTFMRRRDP